MAFDAHANFAVSTIATAPSPATSGTSLVVASGEGSRFPATPFNAVVWPAGVNPTPANAEVIRVTTTSTDTFSPITRAQESSTARSIIVGDQIAAAITAKTLTDVEGNVDNTAPVTQAFGDAAASGSSAIFARRDHKHGMPSIPIGSSMLVYRYTVVGSDKASIDTGVDAADAGSNDWTDGDLLEVEMYLRTDEAVAVSGVNITVNNDGSSIYDRIFVQGANATASANNIRAAASWAINAAGANLGLAAAFSTVRISMPNFAGTVGNKHGEMHTAVVDSTAANCGSVIYGIGYRSTLAVTRLKIIPTTAAKNFKVGSQLLIYKRKAS